MLPVIENIELGLDECQKYLTKLTEIIYFDVIPPKYFPKILRCPIQLYRWW